METIIHPSRGAAYEALKKFMSRVDALGMPESVLKIERPVLDYSDSSSTIRTTLDFGGDRYALQVKFWYTWYNDTINAKGCWWAEPDGVVVHEIMLASEPDFVEGIQCVFGEAVGVVFSKMADETRNGETHLWAGHWWSNMPN